MARPVLMSAVGFDNEKYLRDQYSAIVERASRNSDRLYIEFGGKLVSDMHASRVLPGFDPDVKMKLLQKLKEKIDVILCIYSGDIEHKKLRADFGLSYDDEMLRTIDTFRKWGIEITAVVITRFSGQPLSTSFIKKLQKRNVRVYTHKAIDGYPTDVDRVLSENGFGMNPYIETTKPIVIVNAPGPNSGKLATCLSQVYHERKRGINARYAKFETFPIWNLPVSHPVNVAYEAATADIDDKNLIDPFHLKAYGIEATNYNRDIDAFPVLSKIIERLSDESFDYKSPTDMGVNRAGFAIIDDNIVREASKQEIIRRFFQYQSAAILGQGCPEAPARVLEIMKNLGISENDRVVVSAARAAAKEAKTKQGKGADGIFAGAAIQLPNNTIVTGQNSALFHAASACVLNAIKRLAGLPNELLLLVPDVIKSVGEMKKEVLQNQNLSLDLEETLIVLSVSAPVNPSAKLALGKLSCLRGCEMHLSHLPTRGDENGLRKMGIRYTCDPTFSSRSLLIE